MKWIANRLKDLLYDASDEHLDIGRCVSWLALVNLIGAALWNMHLHKDINLSEYGTGLGVVLTALVVYIYHDRKQNGS